MSDNDQGRIFFLVLPPASNIQHHHIVVARVVSVQRLVLLESRTNTRAIITMITEITHTASGARCKVHELGATVLSYFDGKREILFVSREAKLDGSKAIRGGVPLVFPIFGPPTEPDSTMPQHGFARNNVWKMGEVFDTEESAGVSFTLELKDVKNGRGEHNAWEGDELDVALELTIEFSDLNMTMTLEVSNEGEKDFPFQALFHTYYQVDGSAALDPEQCSVRGLGGYQVIDKVTKEESIASDDPIPITGEVDRVYSPAGPKLSADVSIAVGTAHTVTLSCFGDADGEMVPVSVVVWNPHKEKAAAMGDFGDDQYNDMICVEPGILGSPTLPSSSSAKLVQVISSVH